MMNVNSATRRRFLKASGTSLATVSAAGFILNSCGEPLPSGSTQSAVTPTSSVVAKDPLQRLLEGNARFQAGTVLRPNQTMARRTAVAQKQNPFAIIFGCVDSRVSPEMVFDQGLGDLFTIRTAGQALDKTSLGSLEFGVAELHIPLLVVLGHQRCGAVSATITAVDTHEDAPGSIAALVAYIRPAVLAASGTGAARLESAVRLNINNTVRQLYQSTIINNAVQSKKLTVVGARYDLDTGAVTILPQ